MIPKEAYVLIKNDRSLIGNIELESIIATCPHNSFCYALWILGGRFELGEETISQSGDYSYNYARSVLCGRFEPGEDAILTDVMLVYKYSRDVIKGLWLEGIPQLLKVDYIIVTYIKSIPNSLPLLKHMPRSDMDVFVDWYFRG